MCKRQDFRNIKLEKNRDENEEGNLENRDSDCCVHPYGGSHGAGDYLVHEYAVRGI
jgi:hypothetical protein